CQVRLRLPGGRARQDVDHATDRVRTVQGRARALGNLDAASLRNIDFIQAVMVEQAGRACRNAVFQKKVDTLGGEWLANGGHMALAAKVVDVYARHAIGQLCRMSRLD